MKISLTAKLLRFLIGRGYRFCLSKTVASETNREKVTINLTPVYKRPQLRNLPCGYDTYFNIVLEPVQMAEGIDDAYVYVKLDNETLLAYIKSIVAPLTGSKLSYE